MKVHKSKLYFITIIDTAIVAAIIYTPFDSFSVEYEIIQAMIKETVSKVL